VSASKAVLTAMILGLLVGCGGSGGSIDANGARLLQSEVRAARAAAAEGDLAGAMTNLHAVDQAVAALRRGNKISSTRAANVVSAVHAVEAALARVGATSTQPTVRTTTSTSTPTTTAPPPPRGRHGEKGHGKD